MLRRFLCALLLLALSAPALAMSGHCAELPAGEAHASSHEGSHHRAPAQPERGDCIGCVLPDLGIAPALKAEAPAMMIGVARPIETAALPRHKPDTPPPRA